MHRLLGATCFLLLTCFAATAAAMADESVSLRHQFEKGADFYLAKHENAQVVVSLESGDSTLSHTADSLRRFRVVDVAADGNATIRLEIVEIQMTATTSEGSISYDSRSTTKPIEQFEEVAETIGKPLAEFVVTTKGEVVSVKPIHESATELDTSAQSLEHPFVLLPDEPIAVGDRWSETLKTVVKLPEKLPESVKLKRNYVLESIDGDVAKVSWKTLVLTPIQDPTLEGEIVQRAFHGSYTFDVSAGGLVTRDAEASGDVVGFQGPGTHLKSKISRRESMKTPKAVAAGKPALLSQ